MHTITIENLAMEYGGRLLFMDASLRLTTGKRYGIVGANGSGKSTLLRLIAGTETAIDGTITVSKNARIGWLKQDQHLYESDTILDVVLRGKPILYAALQEQQKLLAQDTIDDKSGFRIAELEEIIAQHDGYRAEATAHALLTGLGIPEENHSKLLSSLSGGFKLRALLAQTLFDNPEILLLDEPTNYLDLPSIAWLEEYLLQEFEGLLIFISHDGDFLNHLATEILDIDYGEIRAYTGNYDHFLKEKAGVVEQKMHERAYMERKIGHLRRFIDRFGALASRARQAASREKQLEKLELPNVESSSRKRPSFRFDQKRHSGRPALRVSNLSKTFGQHEVLKGVSCTIERGERIAIIGANGKGKSTFLKVCLGLIPPDSGTVQWGAEASIAYFAQDHHETLKENISSIEWLSRDLVNVPEEHIYRALGMMLFKGNDFKKSILALSGGEATRLLFAKMMLQQSNIMILDEPTNHLDIESREALAEALSHYPGTCLFVSHDRQFNHRAATRTLIVENGKLQEVHHR